jgi:hypothetical protein
MAINRYAEEAKQESTKNQRLSDERNSRVSENSQLDASKLQKKEERRMKGSKQERKK